MINIASKSGSSDLSAKVYVRSSLGGLDHAGPDVYDAKPDADVMSGMSAAEVFLAKKAALLAGNDAQKATAQFMTWEPGAYEYGEDPRINAEVYLGGPLTSKGNFFFSGNMLNDHGRFPGEFNRNIDGSLKINYKITKSDKLTLMGKLQDGGKLGGWYNRFYTYTNQFLPGRPAGQPDPRLFVLFETQPCLRLQHFSGKHHQPGRQQPHLRFFPQGWQAGLWRIW